MAVKKKKTAEMKAGLPIYVVHGKERRRGVDMLEQLIEMSLAGADPQMALNSYEGADAELAPVLDDLRTLPFLAERRVVVVKDADAFISRYRGELETYLENPAATGVLIMLADSFPSNTRLAKKAAVVGQVFSCDPVKGRQLPGYLIDYAAREHDIRLQSQAAEMLIEIGGDDSGMLLGEIDKLAAYLIGKRKKKEQITTADVEAVVGHNRQFTVFNVIDAMTRNDTGAALELLEQMLHQDREAEFKAVGAFAWHFRRLYQGRAMAEKGIADSNIVQQLRIWPVSAQRPFMQQVKRMKLAEIAEGLKELMKIDLGSKTGGAAVREGLEKLIIRFCRLRNRVA